MQPEQSTVSRKCLSELISLKLKFRGAHPGTLEVNPMYLGIEREL